MQGRDNAHKGFNKVPTMQQALIILVYRLYFRQDVAGIVVSVSSPWKSRRANSKMFSCVHDQDRLNCMFFDF